MKKNLGRIDRILRSVLGCVLLILYLDSTLNGLVGTVAVIFSGLLFATSAIGNCPLYIPLKITTLERLNDKI